MKQPVSRSARRPAALAALAAALVAAACLLLVSCDTVIFEDDTGVIGSPCAVYTARDGGDHFVSDGTYGSYIFDKTQNEFFKLNFEEENAATHIHILDWTFAGETLRVSAYCEKPQYDVNTGLYDHSQYFPAVYTFDLQGRQLSCEKGETRVSAEEVDLTRRTDIPAEFEGIEEIVHQSVSNSVYDRLEDGELPLPERLNETETAIFRYVFEKQGISWDEMPDSPFFDFQVNAKRVGDKIWFSYRYCNKKNWSGQSRVWSGVRAAGVCTYDEATDTFEDILTAGKQSVILSFTDTTVLYYQNGRLRIYDVASGKTEAGLKLPESTYFAVMDDRLFIHTGGTGALLSGEIQNGTLTYTYIFDLSGTLLRDNSGE